MERRENKSKLDQVLVQNGLRLQDASQSIVGRSLARDRGARGACDHRSKRRRREDMWLPDGAGLGGGGGGQSQEMEDNEFNEEGEEGDRQPLKRNSWGQVAWAAAEKSAHKTDGVTELVKKNRMERKEHQEKVLDHMLRTEKREEDRAERELRAAKREEERAEWELKMLEQNAQVLNQNKQVLEQVNRQAEVQAEEIKVLKELVLFMKNK
jgi:hypothetical protein